jgi:hypothetical protein
MTNPPKFPVTPGAAFTFEVPYAARIGTEHAAYVAVLFVDDAGREVSRCFLYLESLENTLVTLQTPADGSFKIEPDGSLLKSQPQEVLADFPGNDRFRGATALRQ